MNIEKKEIIKLILIQHSVGVDRLADSLGLTADQLKQAVFAINHELPGETIQMMDGKISVSARCADDLYALLVGSDPYRAEDSEAEIRQQLLAITFMVLKQQDSLQTLADRFYVSRNTIYADIRQIKADLSGSQLGIHYSRKEGYRISGPEYLLRNQLVQLTRELLKTLYGKSRLLHMQLVDERDIVLLKKSLKQIEQNAQIRLTDEQNETLPLILAVLINRVRHYPEPWSFKIEKYDIGNTKEYPIIREALKPFDFLKESDLLYLSLHILSSNRIESALNFLNSEEIRSAIDRFVETIKLKLAVNFSRETEFKEKLLLHVEPAIFRNIVGFRVNNPLTERFISEHQQIFQAVKASVGPFEQMIGHGLSDEENVYLSMIVLGWLYQTKENRNQYFRAVVLCTNGTSVSKLLLENLKDMFPSIDFLGAFSFGQFEQMDMKLDFIFTTKPLESTTPTIVVPPFLEPGSRRQLRATMSRLLKNNSSIQAKRIVSVLRSVLTKDQMYQAERELKAFFDGNKKNEDRGTPNRFTLDKENVQFIEYPVSWEQAVECVFLPMLRRGSADVHYFNRCKEAFYANYSRMLIGPGVYLPHTAPLPKQKVPDIEITVFRRPFRDPDGSLCSVMIGLVPSASNAHVPLLLHLNQAFLIKETIPCICNARNEEEVLQCLEGGDETKIVM